MLDNVIIRRGEGRSTYYGQSRNRAINLPIMPSDTSLQFLKRKQDVNRINRTCAYYR